MKHFTKNLLVWAVLLACMLGLFAGCTVGEDSESPKRTTTPVLDDDFFFPDDFPDEPGWEDTVRDPEEDLSNYYFWLSSDDGSINYMRFMYRRSCYYAYRAYSWLATERYNQLLRDYYDLSGPYYLTGTIKWIDGSANYTIMLVDDGGCIYVASVDDYVHLVVGDQVTVYGELAPGTYTKDGVEMRAPMVVARDYHMGYDTVNNIDLGVLLDAAKYRKPDKIWNGIPDMADWIYDYWMEVTYIDAGGGMYRFDGMNNTINGYHYDVHYWYVNVSDGSMLLMVHVDGVPEDKYTYFIFKYDDLHSYTINDSTGRQEGTIYPFCDIDSATMLDD